MQSEQSDLRTAYFWKVWVLAEIISQYPVRRYRRAIVCLASAFRFLVSVNRRYEFIVECHQVSDVKRRIDDNRP